MKSQKIDRKVSVFEILLLIVGIGIIAAGIYIFNLLLAEGYALLDYITFVILWLVLIFLLIMCAISENSREELGIIISENNKEIKLLRDISKEHLEEVKLMRESLSSKKKK